MIAEISAVIAAVMSCISAYFAMMAATVNTRHWRHIKRRKHDLIFVVSDAYSTWNFMQIQADMSGVLPDNQGRLFPISTDGDVKKLLDAVTFSQEIVDAEAILFGDVNDSVTIRHVRNWFTLTKWFSIVDYTDKGRKRLKKEARYRT